MNRLRLLANWLALDSAPITTAESPRWKSARMSIWAAEAGFSPSKQQFFLGFRLHLLVSNKLVSNKGAICDFVLSPANVGERRVAEHLLAVEAKWQARQSAFLAKARPVLADNGYCGDWLASLFGKNGGALWYALRRSKKAKSEGEAALRAWHRGLRARIEGVFSSLEDALGGPLERPSDLIEDATDLRLVIGHPKLPFDHLLYAPPGPHLSAKTVVLRPFFQKRRKLLPVFVGEALVRTSIDVATQRLLALPLLRAAHPLAYRPVGHAERLGNVGLFPSFFFEFEGAHPPFFFPSVGSERSMARPLLSNITCALCIVLHTAPEV